MSVKNTGVRCFFITILIMLSVFASKYSSLLFVVSLFLVPALNSHITCKCSFVTAVYADISAIIFGIVSSLISDTFSYFDLMTYLYIIIPGMIIGLSFKNKKSFKDIMIYSLAFDFLMLIGILAIVKFGFGFNLTKEIQNTIVALYDEYIDIFKALYPASAKELDNVRNTLFEAMYIGIPGIVPFVASVLFMFTFLLKYAMCKIACMKQLITSGNFADGFDTFRPGIVTNISMLIFLFFSFFGDSIFFSLMCANCVLFILMLYFVGALSFIEYKLKASIFYPLRRFAILVAILVVTFILTLQAPIVNFLYIFILIGITDSLFDFRKLKNKKGEADEK